MAKELITVDGTEARLFQSGIRCDYYVTESGAVYSLSKGREARTRRLTACTSGHKHPTIRVKVLDGNSVVVRNLPIYRIVFDIFSGKYHDWNRCRISFIDGNPLNYSFANMRIIPMRKYSRILLESLEEAKDVYSRSFDYICGRMMNWFKSIGLQDAKDIVSAAFYDLCRENAPKVDNFERCWLRGSYRLGLHFCAGVLRRVLIKNEEISFEEISYDYCNLSIYADLGLTPQEKVLLDLVMKGYTRTEAAIMMGYSLGRFPVKLYNIAAKLRAVYNA